MPGSLLNLTYYEPLEKPLSQGNRLWILSAPTATPLSLTIKQEIPLGAQPPARHAAPIFMRAYSASTTTRAHIMPAENLRPTES